MALRMQKRKGYRYYEFRVRWAGYSPDDDCWLPKKSLWNVQAYMLAALSLSSRAPAIMHGILETHAWLPKSLQALAWTWLFFFSLLRATWDGWVAHRGVVGRLQRRRWSMSSKQKQQDLSVMGGMDGAAAEESAAADPTTASSSAAAASYNTSLYLADEYKAIEDLRHECVLAGTAGAADSQFQGPCNLVIDDNDNIIVADRNNHRIQAISSDDGSALSKIGSSGQGDGEFSYPGGVALDKKSGRLYVADTFNHRVQVLDYAGGSNGWMRFAFKFGSLGQQHCDLHHASDIAISQHDSLVYVAELGNHRVQVFTAAGEHVRMIGADQLTYPSSIALDEDDNIYTTDRSSHCVFVFSKDGSLVRRFGSQGSSHGELNDPQSICIDQHRGLVIVGDYNGIQAFTKDGAFVHKLGDKTFRTTGLGVDSQGRIVASKYNTGTIERWA